MSRAIPWLVVSTVVVGSLIQAAVFWPHLPEQVPSHFNGAGQPDAWTSKFWFVTMSVLIQTGMAAIMYGTGVLIRVLPPWMVNIPNRQYWLSEDRRQQTLLELDSVLAWIAVITAVFMLVIFWLTYVAAVEEKTLNTAMTSIAVIGYLVGLLGYCLFSTLKYFRIPKSES